MHQNRFSFATIAVLTLAGALLISSGYRLMQVFSDKTHQPIVVTYAKASLGPKEKARWLADVETMQMTVHYQRQQLESVKQRFNRLWAEENKFVMMGHIGFADNDAFVTQAMRLRKLIVQYDQQLDMIGEQLKTLKLKRFTT